MKKLKLICLLLLCGIILNGCNFDESDSLYNFEKPYAGIYKCESINLGGKEISDDFSSYTLELKASGEMIEKYKKTDNDIIYSEKAKYTINGNKILTDKKDSTIIYEKGKIFIFYDINGTAFIAKFKR